MNGKVGVLGSGNVGKALGAGLSRLGYSVTIGTRHPGKLADWITKAGSNVSLGSFKDATRFGDLIFLCTAWSGTQNALELSGHENFSGKVLVDVTNPLLFEAEGQAPKLAVAYPSSGGQSVQTWLPEAKVVKAFNTVPSHYMTQPGLADGTADLFIAGNDPSSKEKVTQIATAWGWPVTDMGDISQAYLLEALAMMWIQYGFRNNYWNHAFKLLKK